MRVFKSYYLKVLYKAFLLQGFCYLELSTRRIFAFYFSLEAYL